MKRWSTTVGASTALAILAGVLIGCGGDDSASSDSGTADSGASGAAEPVKLTYRLDWLVGGAHTCYYRAASAGHFEKQGLDVEILEGSGSGTTATLVANGENDFGFSDAGVVAKTVNTGAAIKLVAGIYQRTPSVIISLKESGINGPADLDGKTVGASTGEAPLQLLPAYLSAAGVDPKAAKVVNMDPGSKIPALLKGRVDAIVGYATDDLPAAETEAPGKLAVQYYADNGVTTLSNGIITSQKMIDEQPETVRKFVTAVQDGFADCEADQAGAVAELAEEFPQKVNEEQATIALREVLNSLHTEKTEGKATGFIEPEDFADTLSTLEQYADLKDPQAPETYFTNEFVE
jgi:NitT/TauT family transport system substrate-binding protein